MFIFTARVTRKRLIAGVAVFILLCGTVITASCLNSDPSVNAAATAAAPKKVKTNEDRIAYLESFGWKVVSQPLAVEELLIPEQFDETYTEYLDLQKSQGFDLTQYCGKRAKRCTYEITNYPTGEGSVQASILIYKNQVIGGEVLSARLDGFIHGLTMPS